MITLDIHEFISLPTRVSISV